MNRDSVMHFTRFMRQIGLLMGLACTGLYSSPGMAIITAGSCAAAAMDTSPYIFTPLPVTLTNGFVLASRTVTSNYTYKKTGTTSDVLYTGASYATGTMNTTYNTLPVNGPKGVVQGVGFRMTSQGDPGGIVVIGSPFGILNSRTTTIAGSDLRESDEWLQELVVTNASIYQGGQIIGLNGVALQIIFGNQATWTAQNAQPGGTRCTALQLVSSSNILTPGGGGGLPELPIPKTPTCDLGGVNIEVDLQNVESSALKNSGDISGGKEFSISLGNCGKNAKPYITFTDGNNKANRTTTLGLAASSTATGVGVVIEKSGGGLVQFGAQNTSVSASNAGQFLVGTSAADGSSIPLKMTARYIRTEGDIKPGEVKSDAIFTIAYP
ncbi:fimbrial protein [Serratia sp. L9]|uniref:fimbrial protein n=1 Tax=Serratia sp. L9 TaxID=3423946 RepID=UPI003D673E8F